ncbi:MAG: hypothetical protein H0T90_07885 [Gemmatimonadales bacterium]|nr:hypothetical protein [Gemmatimonadales bacterium]
MKRALRIGVIGMLLLGGRSAAAAAQQVHQVRLEMNAGNDEYRFSPSTISAQPGDVLLFKTASGAPHSVVFEPKALSPRARDALNSAMPRRSADLSSPLLTENGAEYRVVVPALPTGAYAFYCLPHRAYDMRGELRIR